MPLNYSSVLGYAFSMFQNHLRMPLNYSSVLGYAFSKSSTGPREQCTLYAHLAGSYRSTLLSWCFEGHRPRRERLIWIVVVYTIALFYLAVATPRYKSVLMEWQHVRSPIQLCKTLEALQPTPQSRAAIAFAIFHIDRHQAFLWKG